jgi:S1-C subfamily serine protease
MRMNKISTVSAGTLVRICSFWAILTGCVHAQQASLISEPSFSKASIGSVEFDTTLGKSRIGTGSFVRIKQNGRCYILTVRHLLGPNVDFPKAVAPQDVPNVVKGIHFYPLSGTDDYFSVTGLVFEPTGDINQDPIFDLAAYLVQSPPEQTLTLATTPPASGETIWIVAHVRGGAPDGEVAHSAKVIATPGAWLHAIWDNDKIDSFGASGAPVLNAGGEVVGVESGHTMWNGHKVAFIIPAATILSAIKSSSSP